LIALSLLLGLAAADYGVLVMGATDPNGGGTAALLGVTVLVAVGVAVGAWLGGRQLAPHRGLGLLPIGATLLAGSFLWMSLRAEFIIPCLLLSLAAGLAGNPLRSYYQAALPAEARGHGTAILIATVGLTVFLLFSLILLTPPDLHAARAEFLVLAILAAVFAGLAWVVLLRNSIEQVAELILWPLYRIHSRGPGVALFPQRGPLLVIANHAAWLDPVWLMKVLPRPLTPMMLSSFYDLPGWRWLLSRVFGVIRVPWSNYRREAPELNEAIKALDRGECVLIFPEAWLARQPNHLHRFGQGIWRILRARPNTPVVCCWIEGGWGSFTSHAGGPPLKNKWPDFWRRIDIVISAPVQIDPALLEDGLATRRHLMHLCAEARRHLGLEPVPLDEPLTAPPEPAPAHS
jgi:1-acyl-sn-glycerol-3-phosphate acyltransferase